MGTWGKNTEDSPVRAHLKLFHLFIVPAEGGWCRRIKRAVLVNINLEKP